MAKYARKSGKKYRKKFGKGKGKFSTGHRSKLGKPSKGLASSRYMFAPRNAETITNIGGVAAVDGWSNNLDLSMAMHDGTFKLDDITTSFQYITMFDAYRINAVKIEFIPQGTITQSGIGIPQALLCWNFTDNEGKYQGAGSMPNEAQLLTMQRCRKRRMITSNGNGITVYAKMFQKNTMSGGFYSRQKPKWISTAESAVQHYGLNTCFTRQDSSYTNPLALPAIPIKMITTYYIECRGVK